jgi:hypothetical protein
MARPLVSMAVMLLMAPVAGRAEQGPTGAETIPAVLPLVEPHVANPVARPTREQWNDFADPLRDAEESGVERA